ncbi:unnamed protein product, partial [Rotaria magnacalcarata]
MAYNVGISPNSIVAADFNNDTWLDLALTLSNESSVGVLFNDGNGVFQGLVKYTVGSSPSSVKANYYSKSG